MKRSTIKVVFTAALVFCLLISQNSAADDSKVSSQLLPFRSGQMRAMLLELIPTSHFKTFGFNSSEKNLAPQKPNSMPLYSLPYAPTHPFSSSSLESKP